MLTIEPGDFGVYETIAYAFTGYAVCIDEVDYELVGASKTSFIVVPVDDDMAPIEPVRELHIPFINDTEMLVY